MSAPISVVQPGVCILLPVLNERANIAELLDRIERVLTGIPHTVCIVDDGSKDGTLEYLAECAANPTGPVHLIRRVKTTRGSVRGSALHESLLWGLQNTTHGIFVEMDGDLSHRPEELPEGIALIAGGQFDLAIASKYVPGSRVTNRPWGRLMVSRVCSSAVGAVISPRIRDYSNGYRFYSRAAAEMVAEHEIRYASPIYLTEVLALWLRQGLGVAEFQTTYIGRNEGVSKLRFVDLFKAVLAIFEVSFRYHVTGFKRVRRKAAGRPAVNAAAAAISGKRVPPQR
ncbi:MAG TPA: glycosyltransferase [Bryobacteraceae bacterium]|nr:glycosyltransferase [Bryobacteraceae bacterium]